MRVACTSEGEASQLGDIEEEDEAALVAQSPPNRLRQVPPYCRLHAELLAECAAVHHDGTNAHVHSVGHTHKDHSGRLQPPVLPPFRKTLIVTISFVSPKRWADAGVCITFGALQVDTNEGCGRRGCVVVATIFAWS